MFIKKTYSYLIIIVIILLSQILINNKECLAVDHPIPEYFGIYLLHNGQLINLNKQYKDKPTTLNNNPEFIIFFRGNKLDAAINGLKICSMKYLNKKIDYTSGNMLGP